MLKQIFITVVVVFVLGAAVLLAVATSDQWLVQGLCHGNCFR